MTRGPRDESRRDSAWATFKTGLWSWKSRRYRARRQGNGQHAGTGQKGHRAPSFGHSKFLLRNAADLGSLPRHARRYVQKTPQVSDFLPERPGLFSSSPSPAGGRNARAEVLWLWTRPRKDRLWTPVSGGTCWRSMPRLRRFTHGLTGTADRRRRSSAVDLRTGNSRDSPLGARNPARRLDVPHRAKPPSERSAGTGRSAETHCRDLELRHGGACRRRRANGSASHLCPRARAGGPVCRRSRARFCCS